jgi:regulatory protein
MTETADLTRFEAAREAALKLLERTRRTRSDLVRRLRDRDFDSATIEAVLARLAGVGVVDDIEYARAYLAERWGRRAAGWRRLEADLRRKGIETADIAAARERMEAETGGADEVSLARRALAQSARRLEKLDPRVRRQRSWALLARRGFDPDIIEQALRAAPAGGED